MSEIKKFMYVNRKAPYGTIYALESLEVVLIGAAFEQDVSLAFMDDGVFQLTKGQNTAGIGMKNFSPTYTALGDYDVNKIYVDKESLEERGLTPDDLKIWSRKTRTRTMLKRNPYAWSAAPNWQTSWPSKTFYSIFEEPRNMTMSHLVNKSPFERLSLENASTITRDGDQLLLIEDGVYGAMKSSTARQAC